MSIEARAAMTLDVLTVGPEETVASVAQKMVQRAVSAVPVVDAEGKLLGMLSEGDVMRHFGAEYQDRRSRWLAQIAEGQKLAPDFLEYVRLDKQHAKDLMTAPVITASPDARLSEIADLLLSKKVKRVPIVEAGKLVGVVSRADLMRRIVESPDDLIDALVDPN